MKLILGSDHAGYEHKKQLIQHIEKMGILYSDVGTNNSSSVDYPDYAHAVSKEVLKDPSHKGILICGSANGVAMASNKHKGVRAAICWNEEIAKLAIKHNDANILSIPARFINIKTTIKILEVFLKEKFEGGRHERRVNKINK